MWARASVPRVGSGGPMRSTTSSIRASPIGPDVPVAGDRHQDLRGGRGQLHGDGDGAGIVGEVAAGATDLHGSTPG